MTPTEAGQLLGVADDASDDEIRRAWRTWASVLHPDHGGSIVEFRRAREAYDVLRHRATPRPPAPSPTPSPGMPPSAMQRPSLADVLRRPVPWGRVALLLAAATLLGLVPALSPGSLGLMSVPPALGSAGVALAIAAITLSPDADAAHRVSASAVAWAAATAGQLVVSAIAGTPLITVLPLLALPLVAYTSVALFPGLRR